MAAVAAAQAEDDEDEDGLIYEELDGDSGQVSQASLYGHMGQFAQ